VEVLLSIGPVVVLGIGDMEWQSLALGKENFSSCHCNHCQQSQENFSKGIGEVWTLQTIKDAAKIHCDNLAYRIGRGLKTAPAGHKGVRSDPLFSIPMHLWVSPVLHLELGLTLDAL